MQLALGSVIIAIRSGQFNNLNFDDPRLSQLEALHRLGDANLQELSTEIKSQIYKGDCGPPNDAVRALIKKARQFQARTLWELRRLTRGLGITEAQLRAYERACDATRLPSGSAYWHDQVLRVRSTEDLDEMAGSALDQLLPMVHPKWLAAQAEEQYRLAADFLNAPLHLVGGMRVGVGPQIAGPQRFARMLLVTKDHLAKRHDLDFYNAAMFVPEIAILGNSVEEVIALGPEAQRKFSALPSISDDLVTSTTYELLVGAACVRRGLQVEMLAEDRSKPTPDFRLTGVGAIPGAIECKRRLGLTRYELAEAYRVETLYDAIRPTLYERGIHSSIEVTFSTPLHELKAEAFVKDVLAAADPHKDSEQRQVLWGSIAVRRLPYYDTVPLTRLYSPDFLERVFDWRMSQSDWDGILCEVEPPREILVRKYRWPMCLKWRSDNPEAFAKKSRGIMSQWGSAVKQVPPGDIGFIYIAYPEGSRPAVADARTKNIIKSMEESWNRWYVRIPVTVIDRLYPRPVGCGNPDLIESSLPGAAKGKEVWLTYLPWLVFTRQFEGDD